MPKLFGPCFIAAMVNSDSIRVAQKNDISLLPYDRIETIDLLPSLDDDFSEGFLGDP
jgi:hypothetical protein